MTRSFFLLFSKNPKNQFESSFLKLKKENEDLKNKAFHLDHLSQKLLDETIKQSSALYETASTLDEISSIIHKSSAPTAFFKELEISLLEIKKALTEIENSNQQNEKISTKIQKISSELQNKREEPQLQHSVKNVPSKDDSRFQEDL